MTATVVPTIAGEGNNMTGTIQIDLNGQSQRVNVPANGTTNAVTFTLPPGSLLSGETLDGTYTSAAGIPVFNSSTITPVYLNLDMLAFNTTVTINGVPNLGNPNGDGSQTFVGATPRTFTYNTSVNGESAQTQFFGILPVTFKYADPGTIQSVNFLGTNLPGAFAPLLEGFVSPLFYPALSTSSS